MFFKSKRIKLALGYISASVIIIFGLFMFQTPKNYCSRDGKKFSVGYYDKSRECICSEFGNVEWSCKG